MQRAFARRSERYLGDPHQLQLDFHATDAAADAAAGLAEAVQESGRLVQEHLRQPRPRQRRSERLPEHLPRREVIVEPSASLQTCAEQGPRKLIGYDVVETLKMRRPELYVQVTKYPKLACAGAPQCGVAAPERPTGLVEGDRNDASIAADILTNKYGYHCVPGEAVSMMRVGLSRSGNRTCLQTGPNCDGQEPWWETLAAASRFDNSSRRPP